MKTMIIPAIDVIDGKCVRLTQGDYKACSTYYNDPVDAARRFEDMGMKRLHLVDLDGARASRVVNWRVLERICNATALEVDFSGGIKCDDDLSRVFSSGASLACIGSVAQQNQEKTREWLEKYGADRLIVGADVEDERICIQGWKVKTETTIYELIDVYLPNLKQVMCTDITRDGMLGGVSLELYRKLVARYPTIRWIASGGVASMEDVRALEEIGVFCVIVGKAFYENKWMNLESEI